MSSGDTLSTRVRDDPAVPGMSSPDSALDAVREALWKLRRRAGEPSTREISRLASRAISHTTVQTVLRCDRLPRWGQLELVVGALQGNTDTFQRLWLQARDADGPSLSVSSLATADAQREAIAKAAKRARGFFSADGDMHDEMMEQVTADVRELATKYMRQPLPEILGPLVAAHDNVFSQLEQRQKPDHARELYFLSGVVGGILANASHDLADPHTAFSHARMAFLCAEQVNHNGLRAWIRVCSPSSPTGLASRIKP